jgi:hypothetical protein
MLWGFRFFEDGRGSSSQGLLPISSENSSLTFRLFEIFNVLFCRHVFIILLIVNAIAIK